MSIQKQITRTAEISLETGNYIKIIIIPNSVIDAEDALDNLLVIKNLSNGKKMLKMLDLRGGWKITKSGKEVSKKNYRAESTIARAYVVDSFVQKIMFAFLKTLKNNSVPEEYFNSEAEAESWLLAQAK